MNYVWIPALAIVVVITVMVILNLVRANPCAFGLHKKRYVAIVDLEHCVHRTSWGIYCRKQSSECPYAHRYHAQAARWVCSGNECATTGSECVDKPGLWLIEHGALVPDEKRLIAWQDKLNLHY